MPRACTRSCRRRCRENLIRLLQKTLGDSDIADIEETVKHLPELGYKLIRLVNSAGMGLRHRVDSLSHALVILGLLLPLTQAPERHEPAEVARRVEHCGGLDIEVLARLQVDAMGWGADVGRAD